MPRGLPYEYTTGTPFFTGFTHGDTASGYAPSPTYSGQECVEYARGWSEGNRKAVARSMAAWS